VVATPWGTEDDLRARKLRPGPAASREEVARDQRERLFGAMVVAVAKRGYEKTRVADLLEVSGVSRNTFYRHFSSKEDCFLATIDAIVAAGSKIVKSAFAEGEHAWDDRLRTGLTTLIELIVEHSASARLYYVETYAAGPRAIEKVERMGDRLEKLAKAALDQSPLHAGMPRDGLRAILHGFRRVIQTRLRTGRERDLVEEAPQLLTWALSYQAPPARLRRPRNPPAIDFDPPPDQEARDRVLTAVIELMAERGYRQLTINAIARRAAISLTTFYTEFESKDAAVVAALRRGANRLLEATGPAYQDAPDWPCALAAGVHALFAFLEIEQPFAQFSGVDIHYGSPMVVDVRDELSAAAQAFLSKRRQERPDIEPLIAEVIADSIDALVFDQIVRKGRHRIYELAPTATYLALAPFVGAERACAIANSSR
jgi:AcrR family transcriptional regulator